MPTLGNPGRPVVEISVQERAAIRHALTRFKVGAVYLVPVLKRCYGVDTNHVRVYRVMKEEGLLYHKAEKRFRRRWVRCEREPSNAVWHVNFASDE